MVATCRKHAAVSSRLAALAALNVTIQPRLAGLASSRAIQATLATLAILAILPMLAILATLAILAMLASNRNNIIAMFQDWRGSG